MMSLSAYPWIRLLRLDRPIGILLLLWPTLWSLWLAAEGLPSFKNVMIFVFGCVLMRSAGCIINDYFDREIDGHIERTKNRPLPMPNFGINDKQIYPNALLLTRIIYVSKRAIYWSNVIIKNLFKLRN